MTSPPPDLDDFLQLGENPRHVFEGLASLRRVEFRLGDRLSLARRMGGRPIPRPAQILMGRVTRKIDAPRIMSMPKPIMIKRFRLSAIFPLTPAKNNTVANSTAVNT